MGHELVVIDVEFCVRISSASGGEGDVDEVLAEHIVPHVSSHGSVFVERLVHNVLRVSVLAQEYVLKANFLVTYPCIDLPLITTHLCSDVFLKDSCKGCRRGDVAHPGGKLGVPASNLVSYVAW